MFRRSKLTRAAGGWLRDPDAVFSKSRRMGDGEFTALLVSQRTGGPEDIEKEAFEALIRVRESLGKAAGASVAAYSIGLLALSNTLTALSASGMEIDRSVFSHVALLLIGVTNLWFSTTFAKFCYISTWFGWRRLQAPPADRAVMLIRFPEAFPYFFYFPGATGYPKNIFPKRSDLRQIPPLILMIAVVVVFAIGAIALNLALAVQVWMSGYPTEWTAKLTVIGAVILSLLALTVPRFNDFKKTYHNYAWANFLAGMPEARREAAHQRIALQIAKRGSQN